LEKPALRDRIYPAYHDSGFEVLAVVYEDDAAQPANLAFAGEDQAGLPWPYVADPAKDILLYFDRSATPLNMFIDTETMQIVDIEVGWSETAVDNIIQDNLGL
jgi:hypothetical protein